MARVSWRAAPDHRYWIDVALGNRELSVMLDLGLVDPLGRIGFEVDPGEYDALKQTGQLSRFRRRARRDASGQLSWSESGLVLTQLVSPLTRQRVGPAPHVYVSRGVSGVPSRVGVVFFHALAGCQIIWDLDQQLWQFDYP